LTVVGKPVATVMTSLPGAMRFSPSFGDVSADAATRFADEPELTRTVWRRPNTSLPKRRSNSAAKRPVVSHMSREESTSETTSSASKTRPATGTMVSPCTNGRSGNASAAYSRVSSRIWARSSSARVGSALIRRGRG
jgi:hypothetical protein